MGELRPAMRDSSDFSIDEIRYFDAELVRRAEAIIRLNDEARRLREVLRRVWDDCFGEYRRPRTIEDVRDTLREALDDDAIGERCDECGGTGERVDEIPDEFGVQRHRGICGACVDGRVPR